MHWSRPPIQHARPSQGGAALVRSNAGRTGPFRTRPRGRVHCRTGLSGGNMPTLHEMFDVRGKSVIVTGGASGIGRAYAEVMADNGARVCIFDINAKGLEAVVTAMVARGGDVWGQALDVADRGRMAAAFDTVADRHGRID